MRRSVLLLVSALDGSGPGRVMANLGIELVRLGFNPMLVATHGPVESPLVAEVRDAGLPVENLRMSRMYDVAGASRFLDLLRLRNPAVVHTRTTRADILGRLGGRIGAAVITNIVNMYPHDCLAQHGSLVGRGVMSAARLTRGKTTLFVVNAAALSANVQESFGVTASRTRVVYDGIDLERWSGVEPAQIPGVDENDTVCLTVARLHPQKGLNDLIMAAAEVVATVPNVKFLVAGDGPERAQLAAGIERAGLTGKFLLLGNRDDVPALLARSSVFVLPSHFEGLPSAAIEAMAAGKAIVGTSVAGMPELVEHGVSGWLVPPASPHSLSSALVAALGSDLPGVGLAGRRRAERLFSAHSMAEEFGAVYQEAVHLAGASGSCASW